MSTTQRGHAEGPARIRPSCAKALALMAQGLSNKDIAAQLNVAEGTAKLYLSNGRRRLGLSSCTHTRTQAAFDLVRMIESGELAELSKSTGRP